MIVNIMHLNSAIKYIDKAEKSLKKSYGFAATILELEKIKKDVEEVKEMLREL